MANIHIESLDKIIWNIRDMEKKIKEVFVFRISHEGIMELSEDLALNAEEILKAIEMVRRKAE